MPTIHIRAAAEEELPTLNTISVASKMHWGYPADWLAHWLSDLTLCAEDLERQLVEVLWLDDQPIGFIALEKGVEEVELHNLWIHPEQIGQGLGKHLLQETLNRHVAPGTLVWVVADPHAEGFYQRLGFKTVSWQESYPKGRFLPKMKKVQC